MCKIDTSLLIDDYCKKQYVVTATYSEGEYVAVCNEYDDGTTTIVPVNDRGKVCDRSKTYHHKGRPTATMIRDALRIDRWQPARLVIEKLVA